MRISELHHEFHSQGGKGRIIAVLENVGGLCIYKGILVIRWKSGCIRFNKPAFGFFEFKGLVVDPNIKNSPMFSPVD